jgi:hypothetical protein
MTLVERLEALAKSCGPWEEGEYVLPIAELREVLEDAAKQLRVAQMKIPNFQPRSVTCRP